MGVPVPAIPVTSCTIMGRRTDQLLLDRGGFSDDPDTTARSAGGSHIIGRHHPLPLAYMAGGPAQRRYPNCPKRVFNGFGSIKGEKMSKSVGNVG